MTQNSSSNTDQQGQKTTDQGTVANQLGSWPYGRRDGVQGLM